MAYSKEKKNWEHHGREGEKVKGLGGKKSSGKFRVINQSLKKAH